MWCDHTQEPCGEGGPGAPVQPGVMKGPWREPVSSPTQGPVWRALAWGTCCSRGRDPGAGMGAGLAEHRACLWHHCPSWPGTHSVSRRVMLSPRQGLPRIPLRGIFQGAKVVRGPDWEWGSQDGEWGPGGKVGGSQDGE